MGFISVSPWILLGKRSSGYINNIKTSFHSIQSRLASTLVVAEHNNRSLNSSTLKTLTAAAKLNRPVTVLVAGNGVQGAVEDAKSRSGVSEVIAVDHADLAHQLAEPLTHLLLHIQKQKQFSHILAPCSSFGKNVLPRAAALLHSQQVSDVMEVVTDNTFVRPIYAGNALTKVQFVGKGPCFLTIRMTAFEAANTNESSSHVKVTAMDYPSPESVGEDEDEATKCAAAAVGRSTWVGEEVRANERPDLGSAAVVVSGGRGLKSAENFALLEALADKLGGTVGASRAAVDAGFVPNDLQVGQTGKIVAPDLYIAVGISGAIQHVAGMKDSKTIVAINKDADAPIFQVADYGLVGDLFEILPELIEKIPSRKA